MTFNKSVEIYTAQCISIRKMTTCFVFLKQSSSEISQAAVQSLEVVMKDSNRMKIEKDKLLSLIPQNIECDFCAKKYVWGKVIAQYLVNIAPNVDI